jgi:hypothetical protein
VPDYTPATQADRAPHTPKPAQPSRIEGERLVAADEPGGTRASKNASVIHGASPIHLGEQIQEMESNKMQQKEQIQEMESNKMQQKEHPRNGIE